MDTESPLCLGSSDMIPRTYDIEYEKHLVVSIEQATIINTFPYLVIRVVRNIELAHDPYLHLTFRVE